MLSKGVEIFPGDRDEPLGGIIADTVPFRFSGADHKCGALVLSTLSFNFTKHIIDLVECAYGIKAFDLFGINSMHKRLKEKDPMVLGALDVAVEQHKITTVIIPQHVDFRNNGKSTRFNSALDEDYFHKKNLLESKKIILDLYPDLEVILIYARLINDENEIQFSEILDDGLERIRMIPRFEYKGIYTCPAALIGCMDYRFRREMRNLMRYYLKNNIFELLQFPGATQKFLQNDSTAWNTLDLAIKNGAYNFVAGHHAQCGAYKSMQFRCPMEEEIFHREQLGFFRKMLLDRHPQVSLTTFYARLINGDTQIRFVFFDL